MQEDFEKLIAFCNEPLQTPYHKGLKLYAKILKRVSGLKRDKILDNAKTILKPIADGALKHKSPEDLCEYIATSKVRITLSMEPTKTKNLPNFHLSMFATKAIREGRQEEFGKRVLNVLSHLNPLLIVNIPDALKAKDDDEEKKSDFPDAGNMIQRLVENLDPNNPDTALSMIDELGDTEMSANLRATLEEIKALKGSDKKAAKKRIKELLSNMVSGVVDNYM